MIPGTVVYVYIGSTLNSITQASQGQFDSNTATLVLLIVGSVLAFLGIIVVSVVAKRKIDYILEMNKRRSEMELHYDHKEVESPLTEKKEEIWDVAGN